MKRISYWAKCHRWTARILIVFLFLCLNALGVITGLLLRDKGIYIPTIFLLLLLLVYAMAFILYPDQKGGAFYRKQKFFDLLLAASTYCMIVCMGNHPDRILNYPRPFGAASASSLILPADSTIKHYKTINAFYLTLKDKTGKLLPWKERRKLLKEQVRAIRHAHDISEGSKVLLIVLSVAVALGLIYLLAALACSLSCNGSDFAAVVVGVGGGLVVIFLLILAIRAILGKKRKKAIPHNNDTTAGRAINPAVVSSLHTE